MSPFDAGCLEHVTIQTIQFLGYVRQSLPGIFLLYAPFCQEQLRIRKKWLLAACGAGICTAAFFGACVPETPDAGRMRGAQTRRRGNRLTHFVLHTTGG